MSRPLENRSQNRVVGRAASGDDRRDHAGQHVTRRSAIGQIAVMGTAGVAAVSSWANSVSASTMNVDHGAVDWEQLIGQKFMIQTWDRTQAVAPMLTCFELEEVKRETRDDPNRPAELRTRGAISLLFSSNRDLESATYGFENAAIGRTPLFVHPVVIQNRENDRLYEVVLN